MSVKHENRYQRSVILQGREETDRRLRAEAEIMRDMRLAGVLPARRPVPPPPSSDSKGRVVGWMRANASDYDTATELAEAANAQFRLSGNGLDDVTHWVWDAAVDCMPNAE